MKRNIWIEYLTRIKIKVEVSKKKAKQLIEVRNDHEMINMSKNKEKHIISEWGCSNVRDPFEGILEDEDPIEI